MRTCSRVGVLVLGLVCASGGLAHGAKPEDPEVWLTVGADAVVPARAAFRKRGVELAAPVRTQNGVAVLRARTSQLAPLAELMHHEFRRCGGFLVHDSQEEAVRALAPAPAAQPLSAAAFRAPLDNGEVVRALIAGLEEAQVLRTITALSSFPNRKYDTQSGVDAALWLKGQWETWAQGRSDVTVALYPHAWRQPSVVLTLTGTTRPQEVVVIGGHLDSLSLPGGGTLPAPGADDNASGIASFSEVLRVALAQGYRPERTVKFIGYAAEEAGLLGSREIANQHRSAGVQVVGVLQLDMTNFQGSSVDMGLMTGNTSSAQNAFLVRLLRAYLPDITWRTSSCGYGCSDHVSWDNAGYPASMLFESLFPHYNPTIHTAHDTLARSGGTASHALKFSRLSAAYLAELAKGTLPPTASPPPAPATGARR